VEVDDKFHLADALGARHECPPVTTVSGLRSSGPVSQTPKPADPIPAHIKTLAQATVLDMVATVTSSFNRWVDSTVAENVQRIQNLVDTHESRLCLLIQDAVGTAKEEFRLLMPQQHEIVIKSPVVGGITGDIRKEGRPHFQLQRLVDWLNLRSHVWASGPAGSGKTTAAEQAADVLSLPCYTISCGMSTNDWSLIGFKSPDGKYIAGDMRQPYEHGGVFILDEIDNTPASVLTTINGALSGTHYTFPDTVVRRHPDFVVVGCANTWGTGPDRMYVGRSQIDAATLDRFKKIPWGYDEDAEFDWAGRDQADWVQYVQRVRKYAMDQLMRVVVSPRASIDGARALRNGLTYQVVAEDCIWNGMSSDDSTRIMASVGGINV